MFVNCLYEIKEVIVLIKMNNFCTENQGRKSLVLPKYRESNIYVNIALIQNASNKTPILAVYSTIFSKKC